MKLKFLIFLILISFLPANALATSIATYDFDIYSENDTTINLDQIISSSSVLLQISTNAPATCKYSTAQGLSYSAMSGTFDLSFETLHKKTLTDLSDGIYKHYIKCKDSSDNESKELEASFAVSVPVSAQIVLTEGSPITEGRAELKLITSKIVSQTPSLSYSFDGISYDPIPLFGSGTLWTGYIVIPNSLKEDVGSFKFQGKDLEGVIGTEITNGGIFIVDTVKPEIITDIKAEGYEGRIELTWHFDDEDEIDSFKIYKSTNPGLDHADFYKSVSSSSFSDTAVDKGKTYYYKVSAVDDAGNEGDLSPEKYATALLENTTISSSGLEIRFLGTVDSFISEIDLVSETLEDNREILENKDNKEKDLYESLKLEREIEGAKSELKSLRREVENFKSQSLTKNELDKKINSGKLKLSTIKKKIPENIIIISEKTRQGIIEKSDLELLILEIDPGLLEKTVEKKLEKSLESISENDFKVSREGYNLEIVYLDGTTKEVALIKEKIESPLEENENISIIESIPKEIANSLADINIKNVNYQEVKEDSVVSFSSDTKEIIYSIENHIDLSSLDKIKTVLLHEITEEERAPIFTGYFAFTDLNLSRSYSGIVFGSILVLSLFSYLFIIRRKTSITEKILPIKEKIAKVEREIIAGEIELAKDIYRSLSQEYKNFGKKEKKAIYKDIEFIHKKLNSFTAQR